MISTPRHDGGTRRRRSEIALRPLLLLSIALFVVPAQSARLFGKSKAHRALLVGRTLLDADSEDSAEAGLGEPSWCKNKKSNARFGNKRRCGCKDGPPQVIKDGACCSMIGFRNGQDCNAHGTCDYFPPGPEELEALKKTTKKSKYKYIGEFLEIHEYETPADFRLEDDGLEHYHGTGGNDRGSGAGIGTVAIREANQGTSSAVSTAPHATMHGGGQSGAHHDIDANAVSTRGDDQGNDGAADGDDGDDAADENDQDDDEGEPAGDAPGGSSSSSSGGGGGGGGGGSSSSNSRPDRSASPPRVPDHVHASAEPVRRPGLAAPVWNRGAPHQSVLPRDVALANRPDLLARSQAARLAPPAHVLGSHQREAAPRDDGDEGRMVRLLRDELRREPEHLGEHHRVLHSALPQHTYEHLPPAVITMRNPLEQRALRDATAAAAAIEHAHKDGRHYTHPTSSTTANARPLKPTSTPAAAAAAASASAPAGRTAAAPKLASAPDKKRTPPSAAELDSVFPLLRLSPVTSAALRSAANHSRASVVCARQDSPLYRDFTPEFEAHRRRRVEELRHRSGSSGGGGGNGSGTGAGISAEEDLFHEVRHYGRANCAGVRDTASFASTLLESLRSWLSWLSPPPQPGRLRNSSSSSNNGTTPSFPADDPAGDDYLASVHAAVTSLLEVGSAADAGLADRLHALVHGLETATATATATAAAAAAAAAGYVGYGATKSSGRKQYIMFTDVRRFSSCFVRLLACVCVC
jgi:hypothetical protein